MRELVLKEIQLWNNGEEKKYIKQLAKELSINTEKILAGYNHKLEPLEEGQLKDKTFKFLLLLSEAVKDIHETASKKLVKEINEKLEEEIGEEEVYTQLDHFSQQSDTDFSLLINLKILCEYAKIVQEPKPLKIYEKYLEKIISKIKKAQSKRK